MLTIAAISNPKLSRVVSSAQSFGHYFHAVGSNARSLGPLERLAYSLVLANSQEADTRTR